MKYCSCTSIQSLWIPRYLKIIIKGELLALEIVYLLLLILQGCCKFCQKELSSLKETVMDTVSEVKNLKKQLKKLKRTSGNADQLPESELSLLEKECRELISNSTSVFNTVNILMRRLFTEEEITSHSVSGKASNSTTVAKPKFDTAKLELLKSLVIELHKEI